MCQLSLNYRVALMFLLCFMFFFNLSKEATIYLNHFNYLSCRRLLIIIGHLLLNPPHHHSSVVDHKWVTNSI